MIILAALQDTDYEATIERAILFQIEGWDWNCPQHIPVRYSEQEMQETVNYYQAEILTLKEIIASLTID